MDTVSKVLDWIYTWMDDNNRRIEQHSEELGDVTNGEPELHAMEIRRLSDQNAVWMRIAKALHENEDRNIRGILEER